VEQHRIKTKFGPLVVRLYRLKTGWWPVALSGREQLPADPMIEGHELPTSVAAALQGFADAIDSMTVERPPLGADAADHRRADESAALPLPFTSMPLGR
jgi:hypothetical protein